MNKKVSEFVRKYVEEHLDKSDSKQKFEVFVVWQCYIQGHEGAENKRNTHFQVERATDKGK